MNKYVSKVKRILAVTLAFVMIFCPSFMNIRAAEKTTASISYEVKFRQTDACSMTEMVNGFRTGADAWAWNSDDTTKSDYSNLSALEYR